MGGRWRSHAAFILAILALLALAFVSLMYGAENIKVNVTVEGNRAAISCTSGDPIVKTVPRPAGSYYVIVQCGQDSQ